MSSIPQPAAHRVMLMALRRYQEEGSGGAGDSGLALLPADVLVLVRHWVLHDCLGFVGCCRHGLMDTLLYVKGPRDCATASEKAAQLQRGLGEAAAHGRLEVVQWLVTQGANIHFERPLPYPHGGLPRESGAEKAPWAANGCVLVAGRHMHHPPGPALLQAAAGGHEGLVRWLLEAGPHAQAHTDQALGAASHMGHAGVARLLVETGGASIHADDDYALRTAAARGHWRVVRFLVGAGAHVHAENDYAIRRACSAGFAKTAQYLIDHAAYIPDEALRNASANGHLDIVEALMQRGASIPACAASSLRWASEFGRLAVVRCLLNGASVGADTIDTALHRAVLKGHVEVVRFLAQKGGTPRDDRSIQFLRKHHIRPRLEPRSEPRSSAD